MIEQHYNLDPEWKKNVGKKAIDSYQERGIEAPSNDPLEIGDRVIEGLKRYITAGPVVATVWEGAHCVEIVRKITGGTEPLSSHMGTIRGDFVLDSYQMADADSRAVRNLIHASGSAQEANNEINHWFSTDELVEYKTIQEKILYDVNLDGILE
jgi:nucleoside-diphosphate kinase